MESGNNIVVHVAPADLRGIAFKRYAAVLHNLISERFAIPLAVDAIDISPSERTVVLFNGRPNKSNDAREILALARKIADPALRDGYFG